MPSSAQTQHARSHALLLLQKLLNLRDSASPLTLVLDTLEQSDRPIICEFMSRAQISKTKVIFISFTTLKKPQDATVFISARGKSIEALRTEVASHNPPNTAQKTLLIIDSLHPLCTTHPSSLPLFLSSLITPSTSLVATYHADVPLPLPRSFSEYEPHPLTTLSHLATAVLRVSSLYQAIARRRAQNRSLVEPEWGLNEGREGVLVGLGGQERRSAGPGLVLEMELRRRSGRAVAERFVLVPPPPPPPSSAMAPAAAAKSGRGGMTRLCQLMLLSDHPALRDPGADDQAPGDGDEEPASTFSLGLTEKQRHDREGVVLPYFDAQEDVGGGEGGRILYEMTREDDFDEEEDEI
ncbi:histone acetylation protein 2 [Xylariaceae sp. FL0016]|nr:histone acetylation protein 2 [Xylariaceae sp. FL0016]